MPEIQAHEILVKDLFSAEYRFEIPSYQRPYSWLEQNAEQLFDDVSENASVPADAVANLKPHFVGSMVLVKKDQEAASQVIDGQQRLTTLTILLAAIREVSKGRSVKIDGEDFGESISAYIYERGNAAGGVAASYRLHVKTSDADFFRDQIQKVGGIGTINLNLPLGDSKRRMAENAQLFVKKLNSLNDAQLIRLGQYVLQKIYIALVITVDEESAFRTFNVLNDRGLDLSTADILKAEVIGAVPADSRVNYSKRWESCEEELGSEAFSELFSHIRTIGVRKKAKESIVKEIRDHLKPKASAMDFVDKQVVSYGGVLGELIEENPLVVNNHEEIKRVICWLNQLKSVNYVGNTDWIPVALVLIDKLRGTPDVLLARLEDLERLTFGFMVLGKNASSRIERYGLIIERALMQNGDLGASMELSPEEKTRILASLSGNVYGEYYCKYLLKRLDSHHAGIGAKYADPKVVTIEHILPQKPQAESKWIGDFPDPQIREDLVNKIGNLTLLSGRRNAAAGNKDFDEKKETYFKKKQGHFALTAKLSAEYDQWRLQDFTSRHASLIDDSRHLWKL